MAKKKSELTYLQSPLPSGTKSYKQTKVSWSGLNLRQELDTGMLSMERNISTLEAPYLTPSQSRNVYWGPYDKPISIFGFDDFMVVAYEKDNRIWLDYITAEDEVYKSIALNKVIHVDKYSDLEDYDEEDIDAQVYYFDDDKEVYYKYKDAWEVCNPVSSVVQFNVYDTPTDPVSGQYIKKLLIFPDKKSMDFEITDDDFEVSDMDVLVKTFSSWTKKVYDEETGEYEKETVETPPDTASHNYYYRNTDTEDVYRWVDDESDSENSGWKVSIPPAMPDIKYATVHLSRLFGVDNDRVYASGYNDYTNWNLDTIDEYNESNAWCSPAQSNTKAGGIFTGITTFQSHVICFKRDFMHEIYNTKNPFRIQDIYAEGAIDNRTIQDVDGRLIFVSEDEVKIYTGSNPRIISYNLDIDKITYAVSGTDSRCYYLYFENRDGVGRLFTYDTFVDQWSEQSISSRILSFAHNKNGMYMLCENGNIYKTDTKSYEHNWSFETDLITRQGSSGSPTVDIKHIKKIQILADIAEGTHLSVYLLYDGEDFDAGASHCVYSSNRSGLTPIRFKPRKTAHYGVKLHVEAYGYARLYELELFFEYGGDLYV